MRAEGSAAPQRVWAESPSDASRARADTRAGPMPMAMRFSQVPRFVIPVAWQAHHVAAGGVHGLVGGKRRSPQLRRVLGRPHRPYP
jgi:hypothetical protein